MGAQGVHCLFLIHADSLPGYRLHLIFNGGKERIVDFEPFLRKARHPDIQKYLDPEKFNQYRLLHGDLIWNDFELCFPIAELYEGRVD
ncbi:MAG TPA: DUF2442 domain-containing protein [bacterium]|nr:DUF2442 domain-containing protein [bacterium]